MGIFFANGEKKKRPGVYQRYENNGAPAIAGATNGVVAAVMKADSGKLGVVHTFFSAVDAVRTLGNTNKKMIENIFVGGANEMKVVRLGTGGKAASASLKDKTEGTPVDVVTVTAKSEGTRPLRVAVRLALGSATAKEFAVYENGVQLEKFEFAADPDISTTEADALVKAAAASEFVTVAKITGYTGAGEVGLAADTELTGGEAPSATNGDYSTAFSLLEPYTWNALCVDTVETEVHTLLQAFMTRAHQDGKMAFVVIGDPISVARDTRLSRAKMYNDEKIVYVGGGWYDGEGNVVDGYLAAAQIAAMVASVPANESLTHRAISGATKVAEMLTNYEYEEAIDNGMLTFSTSSAGVVWVESGITTLNTLTGEKDEGWKKIKRTKIRFELMSRANDTVEPLIGVINNNPDGRATVIQAVQGLLNTMVAEDKLLAGAKVEIDPDNAPAGDSAWFVIDADDVDALEKVYFTFRFRFAAV